MTDQRCSSLCRLQHIHTLSVSQPTSLASLAITPPVSSSPFISASYRQFILKTVWPTPFIMDLFSSQSLFHEIYTVSATQTIKTSIHWLMGHNWSKSRKKTFETNTKMGQIIALIRAQPSPVLNVKVNWYLTCRRISNNWKCIVAF